MTHLFHVAAILARAGYDEDTQIAGLLHDVLEDTTRGPREADAVAGQIEATFGPPVARAVRVLTEPKRSDDGVKLPWRVRKDRYLSQLEGGSEMAWRVSAADKLHNLCTLAEQLDQEGDEAWRRFTAGPQETFWFYRQVYEVIRARTQGPVVEALCDQLKAMGVAE